MQLTETEKYDVRQAMAKTWTQMAIAAKLETDDRWLIRSILAI
jgi:hypothetical protein